MTPFEPDDLSFVPEQPTVDMVRLRCTVAYHGKPFHGFALNAGVTTVAGTLADAFATVLRRPVEITCAGRTDRGVHARGQVISLDVPSGGLDLAALQRSVNRLLAPSVAISDATVVDDRFDARFSATGRHYRYLVRNGPVPDPFLVDRAWHVEHPLDRWALDLACDPMVGEHDFAAFCRRPKRADGSTPSLVRSVASARWTDDPSGCLRFEIEANAFCHQMVRSIVGTLVDVGLGRRKAGEVAGIVRGGDRGRAGGLAPPHGLILWSVDYEGWSS